MNVVILGYDGYIGYALTQSLLRQGYDVYGLDNGSRRARVRENGSASLTPISPFYDRPSILYDKYNCQFHKFSSATLGKSGPVHLRHALERIKPQAIFHLAEQPSAPYSMDDIFKSSDTQMENVIGTLHLLWAMKSACPGAHLIKIGTMGEYGTPNCDIPEGKVPDKCISGIDETGQDIGDMTSKCPMSGLLFPRTPGSYYHASKVMDTINIEFACRNWGLRSTDIMQGVVFGLNDEDKEDITRFDYDDMFGTVINRFCAQALIDYPLTVYGSGMQVRGFLPLKDSIQCLEIALNNPPNLGEYRTFNQFENIYSINSLARLVNNAARSLGLCSHISPIPNPRKEAEEHYYNPHHQTLFNLGYKPTTDIETEISNLLLQLLPYQDRVKKDVIKPKTKWNYIC